MTRIVKASTVDIEAVALFVILQLNLRLHTLCYLLCADRRECEVSFQVRANTLHKAP